MINKEKPTNPEKKVENQKQQDSGYIDVVKMDIGSHILIKDKDTGNILINKRG